MKRARLFWLLVLSCFLILAAVREPVSAANLEPENQESRGQTLSSSLPLKISGFAQLLFTGQNNQADTFSVRRARLSLDGRILKNLTFKVQVDLTRSPVLLDALAEVLLDEKFNLRAGQFLVPFSLESTTSAGRLLTVNRSRVVDLLAPGRDNGSSGRDLGLVVFGRLSIFQYSLGLVNGAGINKKDDNERKDFAGRIIASPGLGLRLGLSLYNGRRFDAPTSTNLARNRLGLEASWDFRSFHLNAEYIQGRDDLIEKNGWYVQTAVDLKPDRYQLVFKLDHFDPDRNLPGQAITVYTAGANWFLSPASKLQANFEYHRLEAEPDRSVLLLQLQVGF
ncbi:MAG: OprO/OprP family phosphate-selective porin [Candidatus Saccharicenans sp.]|nr:OprO/OprP family phosphate-selective porin [Candidatus Saccharicenans sp.]